MARPCCKANRRNKIVMTEVTDQTRCGHAWHLVLTTGIEPGAGNGDFLDRPSVARLLITVQNFSQCPSGKQICTGADASQRD